MSTRRTKRRYAHELYPHPEEGEVRPLDVSVPYMYARAIGHDVQGTSWFDLPDEQRRMGTDRIIALIHANQMALIADALLQGMAGDEAWEWAMHRAADESGELVYERAVHYGVPVRTIKPYLCGPEPDQHDHLGEPDARGWRTVTRIQGRESDCDECTEPVPTGEDPWAEKQA